MASIASRSSSCSEPVHRLTSAARFLAGARRVACAALVLGPLAATARAESLDAQGPPPWRVAGRVGFTVDAVAFPDSAGNPLLDVYLRVPPATVTALARDTLSDAARLRVTVRLSGGFGAKPTEQTTEFALASGDSAGGFGRVVGLRMPVRPGPQKLRVRVEDVLAKKRGIIYTGRSVTESSTIQGPLTLAVPRRDADVSDLEFVWAEGAPGAGRAFQRGGATVIPNPERLYGLFATGLRARFTARAVAPVAWSWKARVVDHDGHVVAEQDSSAPATAMLDDALGFDVSAIPAGGYDLVLDLKPGAGAALQRRAHFSIAWHPESWLRNPGEVEDDVHFLLKPDEEDAFALMGPGEQEAYLEAFWAARDPSPGTAVNEARVTFLKRVDYANRTWTHAGLVKGMFSDMGRAYIRYGEPTEIVHQVIPTGDDALDGVLAELRATEDRPLGDVDQKGPGGDQRPFELWIYDGQIGLPPDADPKVTDRVRHRRLVFLFVDEHGLGDFRLRYSTE